jgi:hypothetical protein
MPKLSILILLLELYLQTHFLVLTDISSTIDTLRLAASQTFLDYAYNSVTSFTLEKFVDLLNPDFYRYP